MQTLGQKPGSELRPPFQCDETIRILYGNNLALPVMQLLECRRPDPFNCIQRLAITGQQ
jgi:hypothetical protein